MLKLSPSLHAFWTDIKIGYPESHEDEITTCEHEIAQLCEHERNNFFTDTVVRHRVTFYLHCARCHTPRIARYEFENLGCGIGTWTMQGFENRNK